MNPVETTKAFFQLWGAGSIEEMLERFVTAESVLDNPLPPSIPFGGRYEGQEGFLAYAQQIAAGIKIEQFEIDEIFADGERVTVLGRETSSSLKTGRRYTMSWIHVLTVREGRILDMREYNDTAAMAAAFD